MQLDRQAIVVCQMLTDRRTDRDLQMIILMLHQPRAQYLLAIQTDNHSLRRVLRQNECHDLQRNRARLG
ncbi:hypothetical protein D3C78_1441380 [compost metagenome]